MINDNIRFDGEKKCIASRVSIRKEFLYAPPVASIPGFAIKRVLLLFIIFNFTFRDMQMRRGLLGETNATRKEIPSFVRLPFFPFSTIRYTYFAVRDFATINCFHLRGPSRTILLFKIIIRIQWGISFAAVGLEMKSEPSYYTFVEVISFRFDRRLQRESKVHRQPLLHFLFNPF